jgi:hypothetical protein
MKLSIFLVLLLGLLSTFEQASAANYYDDAAAGDDAAADDAAADDGGNGGDDAAAAYYAADDGGNNQNAYYNFDDAAANYDGDDYIKYWTEYAVLPKKCITYNHVDMVVYSVYAQYYNHCADKPVGTYMTTVPIFAGAWVDQMDLNAADMYGDDYVSPDTTYINCYPYEADSGNIYYVQLGCTDGNSQQLSVNVYSDNTCQTPDKSSGTDDTILDASELQLPFKQCQSCVYFVDKNEDDVDDAYFENRMTNAPLCSTIWANKSKCDGKCRRLGNDAASGGWNKSDKVLLGVLSVFSALMLTIIVKKRSKMSNKEVLIEEAALSAAGVQQTHIIGTFVLILFVTLIFGLLDMKALTWTILLLVNLSLFAYALKLTIDSGLNTPVGPDGEPIRDDSSDEEDDDDDEYEDEEGDYQPPAETPTKTGEPGESAPLPPIL